MIQNLIRIAGVTVLLIVLYAALLSSNPNASGTSNLFDVFNKQGRYGVITLGVAVLIIAGGIDLSLGSVIGLSAVTFGLLMLEGVHPVLALVLTLCGGVLIGLIHGILVSGLRLQAFLVTLCGLFIYRGLARHLSKNSIGLVQITKENPGSSGSINFLRYVLTGEDPEKGLVFPGEFVVMLVLAAVIGLLLHFTIYGRYWYAIGYNENAARYSGISVGRHRTVAFVICSALAAFCGVLWMLAVGDANPENAGQFYELYAITGAVLGGCNLRGGEGTAVGMILGAMVIPLLDNLVVFLGINDAIVQAVIGVTLLFGVIADEMIRRGQKLLPRLFKAKPQTK